MYNRRVNLNTDNNRIAIVNAYIENANNTRSIMQQIMDLMTNQEEMLRELVQNGIMLNDNNNEHVTRSHRTTTRTNNRNINPTLSRRRSNSEASDFFNPIINNTSHTHRPISQRSSRSFNTPSRQPEERLANMLVSMMMMPSFTGQPNTLTDEFLRPIIVRPSQQQIERATEIIRYGDITNPPNSTCPIQLTHFQENDNVTRIMYCGHIFSENSLENWFRENVRCPMCRYDIRNYTGSNIGGEIRRDINVFNLNTDNQHANRNNNNDDSNDNDNMTSLLDDSEENDANENNVNTNEETIENNNNSNNNVRQSPISQPFPRNAFAGLFTSSLNNGNDVSNILNTFMTDLQNDPFFSAFPQQSRNGRFDASGNYIFETYIPINFNRVNSNNSTDSNDSNNN